MSVFVEVIARVDHAAQASLTTDETTAVGESQYDCTVTEVSFIPAGALVASDAASRTFVLTNAGQAGAGVIAVATLVTAATNAIPNFSGNWTAGDEILMTLTPTTANRNVNANDVLTLVETHTGAGVAHPEMQVIVRGTRR
jgi:hypothetical protein